MKMKIRTVWLLVGLVTALFVLGACGADDEGSGVAVLGSDATGEERLQALIDGAREEGELNVYVISALGQEGAAAIASAFNEQFGLDIDFKADTDESEALSQALIEVELGSEATHDIMWQSGYEDAVELIAVNGVACIDEWESILQAMSPKAYAARDQISYLDIEGCGFKWGDWIRVMIYNTELISADELPKTHADVGNAEYAGEYTVTPFNSHIRMLILKYEPEEVINIARAWGAGGGDYLFTGAAIPRLSVGEYKFHTGAGAQKEALFAEGSPLAVAFFEDVTQFIDVYYTPRANAKNPNAAALFALWATTPEANVVWEKFGTATNLSLGTGPLSQKYSKQIQDAGIELVSWFGTAEFAALKDWSDNTDEGKAFKEALDNAYRGRE